MKAASCTAKWPGGMSVVARGGTGAVNGCAVTAGDRWSGALDADGRAYRWGFNTDGLAASGRIPAVVGWLVPQAVPVPAFDAATVLASDRSRLLALRGGIAYWMGPYYHSAEESPDHRAGFATGREPLTPVPLQGLAVGDNHVVGLGADGSVWAWGYNGQGQLGDGTTSDAATPVAVKGLSAVRAIAAGSEHSLALTEDGKVFGWGRTRALDTGTVSSSYEPAPVAALTGVVAISARVANSLALRADGTVWYWGPNDAGQAGDGSANPQRTPVQVAITDVIGIAAGRNHSLALRRDGTVSSWGSGRLLGDGGAYVRRSAPVQVVGLAGIVAIAAGDAHSIALRDDGSLWSWGRNVVGAIGDGTRVDRATPVPVLGFGPAAPGTCAEPPAAPPPPDESRFTLTVTKVGAGATVRSVPAGIDCGAACSAGFRRGLAVQLSVTFDRGSALSGWSGCDRQPAGANPWPDCLVEMTADRTGQVRVE